MTEQQFTQLLEVLTLIADRLWWLAFFVFLSGSASSKVLRVEHKDVK